MYILLQLTDARTTHFAVMNDVIVDSINFDDAWHHETLQLRTVTPASFSLIPILEVGEDTSIGLTNAQGTASVY